MIISKEISNNILTISVFRKEKGGITIIVNTLSGYYESFNYIASTRSKNPFVMCWYFGTCIVKLFYFIFVQKIKIVHLHGSSYGSFVRKMIIINVCRFLKIKIIYHIHGSEFKLFYQKYNKQGIIKKTIDKVNVLIALSESWKHFFSTITNENKIFICNNLVDKPEYNRIFQQNYPIIKYIFLGRIGKRKGIYDLLDVIRDNKDDLKDKFILYIGGDGETDRVIEFIEKQNIQNLVQFEGWVSGEKKKELLSTCDICILPSYNEGLPISILEAMSYGMPIISTNVGGIPEIVSDKVNGFLIEPGNKQKILESIKHFINSPQDIEKMGIRSMKRVTDFYPENVIPRMENIYKNLLQ